MGKHTSNRSQTHKKADSLFGESAFVVVVVWRLAQNDLLSTGDHDAFGFSRVDASTGKVVELS